MSFTINKSPFWAANPLTKSNTNYGCWSHGDGTGWAAAESGTILRYDGDKTTPIQLSSACDFYDICGYSNEEVFAAGTWGYVYHFNGVKWQPMGQATGNNGQPLWIEAIWSEGPGKPLYVCGESGLFATWQAGDWVNIALDKDHRFYQIYGKDDEIYLCGSQGQMVLYRPSKKSVELFSCKEEVSLLDMVRIEGVEGADYIVVGSGGTALGLKGKNLFALETGGVVTPDDAFYGVGTNEFGQLLLIGWGGVAVFYDPKTGWKRVSTGGQSYMEKAFSMGNSQFYCAGWFGRTAIFDIPTLSWKTLTTGSLTQFNGTAISPDTGKYVAVADTGTIAFGSNYRQLNGTQSVFAPPFDLYVAGYLSGNNFVVGGDQGYLARFDLSEAKPTLSPLHVAEPVETLQAVSTLEDNLYIGSSKGGLVQVSLTDARQCSEFRKLCAGQDIQGLAAISETLFLVFDGEDIISVDLQTKKISTVAMPESPTGLSGNYGHCIAFSDNQAYRWESSILDWQSLGTPPLLPEETITCLTVVDAEGNFLMGGSKGTVTSGNLRAPLNSFHSNLSGSSQALFTISGTSVVGGQYFSFLAGTGVGKKFQPPEDSAPASLQSGSNSAGPDGITSWSQAAGSIYAISALRSDNWFSYFGQGGMAGRFQASDKAPMPEPIDIVSGVDLLASTRVVVNGNLVGVIAGGVGVICAMTIDGRLSQCFPQEDLFTATSLRFAPRSQQLFIGTASGAIYVEDLADRSLEQIGSDGLNRYLGDLPSAVVDIVFPMQDSSVIMAVLANGQIWNISRPDSPSIIPYYHGSPLTRSSQSVPDKKGVFFVAGLNNYYAEIDTIAQTTKVISPSQKYQSMHEIFLHGNVGVGREWAGGTSGEVMILCDNEDKWLTAYSGVGNTLYCQDAIPWNYFLQGGTFGCLRYWTTKALDRAAADGHYPIGD